MIGLMDCNNFFVSCERLFRPDLEGKPVVVLSGNDGCIVARSQEVKDMGIAMGVPLFQVKDICDAGGVVLFSGNHALYRDISTRVMQVLEKEVGDIEIYSVDEAFFTLPSTVTEADVHAIRDVVVKNVGIPVSIGAAATKTLAKQASSIGKKGDGVSVLKQKEWEKRAKDVKCGEIWGLGRQTVTKLNRLGVHTAYEYMRLQRSLVISQFGVSGERIYDELQGISVKSIEKQQKGACQSITSTKSFKNTTTGLMILESAVAGHITSCAEKLRKRGVVTSKIHVHIQTDRFGDFFMQGGSAEVVLSEPTSSTAILVKEGLKKVRSLYAVGVPYKKTGVTVSGLMPESYMTTTLFEVEENKKDNTLDVVIDTLNQRFGAGMIHSAVVRPSRDVSTALLRSPSYTTLWRDIPIIGTISPVKDKRTK